MATLISQPARIPLVDPRTGMVTREWQRYFEGLRVGGANGLGTMDVYAGTFAAMQPASVEANYSDIIQHEYFCQAGSTDVSQSDTQSVLMCDIIQQG